LSLDKWLKSMRILDPKKIRVLNADLDTLDMEIDGVVFKGVKPRRPFPYTHPEYLILYDKDEKEIGIIRDYRKLDKRSRHLLEKVLNVIYFMPTIERILSITRSKGWKYKWKVETDKGYCEFETWGRCARLLPNGRIIITDTSGNVYQIKNIASLDSKSISWLMFIL